MSLLRVFAGVCVLALLTPLSTRAQSAQEIIDASAKAYAGAYSYTGDIDSRTITLVFAPAVAGNDQRFDVRGLQYRRLQLKVLRPYGYWLAAQSYRDINAQAGAPTGSMQAIASAQNAWSILARSDSSMPKQGLFMNGRFVVQPVPVPDQFPAMVNSRLGARATDDFVLRHFQAQPGTVTGNIALGLLEPELIGRETKGRPTYRIAAKTIDGDPVTLWIEQDTYLIVRSVVQRPAARSAGSAAMDPRAGGPGMPMPSPFRGYSSVIETFYKNQRLNPPLSSSDFTVSSPPDNGRVTPEEMGFVSVPELVKQAELGPLSDTGKESSAANASGGFDENGNIVSATPTQAPTPTPTPTPTAAIAGQALSMQQMSGIVLIEGEGGTASGFMTKIRDVDFVVTNLHVLGGSKRITMKTLRGEEIEMKGIFGAIGSDIAIVRIGKGQGELTLAKDVVQNSKLGDKVVVVGNRLGGGVATQTYGNIVGVGPTRVEVDANFESGNSGSPIVNLNTNEVIGVASYSEVRRVQIEDTESDSSQSGTTRTRPRESASKIEKRWFGYRVDSVSKWETIDLARFNAQGERIEKFRDLSNALVGVVRLNFRAARQHPRLAKVIEDYEATYRKQGNNNLGAATAMKDLFRAVRLISEDGVQELTRGDYYDYFRTCLYWENSIPAQLDYRAAIVTVLKKYELNSSEFSSRQRNGGN